MKPLYCSFYTLGTPYEQEAELLRVSLLRLAIFPCIKGVRNLRSWTLNCGTKPTFIRERMKASPHRPIIWLDADARVRQEPRLFDELDCDFAAHWMADQLLSGTLYFGATATAKAIAEAWCDEQARTPDVWDQVTLAKALEKFPAARIVPLPPEYCWIQSPGVRNDVSEDHYGQRTPVIVHEQASRRLKDAVPQA